MLHPDELDAIALDTWDVSASKERVAVSARKGRYEGWVLYDEVFHTDLPGEPVAAVAIGKCDICSCFNVWCWGDGQKFAFEGDEADAKCDCSRFWLTSIESDGVLDDGMEVYLSVIMIYSGFAVRATIGQPAVELMRHEEPLPYQRGG